MPCKPAAAACDKCTNIRAKLLILMNSRGCHQNGQSGAEARRIKHLAQLGAASPQTYPQISWTAGKTLSDHALAAFA
jgi:hypothetical protein